MLATIFILRVTRRVLHSINTFSFLFQLLSTRDLTITEILNLFGETLEKQSLTIKMMGELLDGKKLSQEICMRKNYNSR